MSELSNLSRWFLAQVGTTEEPIGSNNVSYNTLYYGRPVTGEKYSWCVTFVWAGFYECGLSKLFLNGEKSAYCPYVMDWAKKNGQWVTENYCEGDILIYGLGEKEPKHVGYCVSRNGNTLCCVEGNYGDRVAKVYRNVSEPLGAYRPNYSSDKKVSAGDVVEILQGASYWDNTGIPSWVMNKQWIVLSVSGKRAVINRSLEGDYNIMSPISVDYLKVISEPAPEEYRDYFVKAGDSLWRIGEKELGSGKKYKEIMEINGLSTTVIYPGQILKLPINYKESTF